MNLSVKLLKVNKKQSRCSKKRSLNNAQSKWLYLSLLRNAKACGKVSKLDLNRKTLEKIIALLSRNVKSLETEQSTYLKPKST